ncbi:MAG: tetratricopeptide repeat protein [Terracidiphilus sp.]
MERQISCLLLFAALVCRPCAAATEQWLEIRSPHFTVLTDAGEKQGRHILDQFERMRWVFQTLFPKANVDPAEPIVVVAAKNEKVFDAMEPAAYLEKGQMKLGGYYMHTQEKNYILLQLGAEFEHPFAAVYHEYTHVQFAGAAEWMPLWLNEGLAEFMQNTEIRDKDVLLGEPSVDNILYMRQNRLIPLDVLFKVDAKSPYYHEEQKGSVFYAESWALTHYLMVTGHEKHANMLGDYMTLVSRHEDPVTAAESAFGDLKQLRSALESYIRGGEYKQFLLSGAAAPIDESSYKARTLTQIEADAARADVLAYAERAADARALLDTVLKEDPNNVQAHETMGYLEFRAGHLDEARKWYGEAVKLDSQDYLAYYYFASLSMSEPDAAGDKEIEDSLRAAIRLNSRFAPAYDRLAVFYAMRRENLDEARRLTLWAIQLQPDNVFYRVNGANVLMAMERFDDAIAVLHAAVKAAKDPSDVAMVESRIDAVEQMQAARAKAEAYQKEQADAARNAQADPGTAEPVTVVAEAPKHPTEPATGPKHAATGVIHGVVCSYPSALEFRVENAAGKAVALYNNDFFKIELTVFGFTPKGDINPCTDFEGMKARVQYVESSDKTVDGQVVAVELRK